MLFINHLNSDSIYRGLSSAIGISSLHASIYCLCGKFIGVNFSYRALQRFTTLSLTLLTAWVIYSLLKDSTIILLIELTISTLNGFDLWL